jgi:hypothetical protein
LTSAVWSFWTPPFTAFHSNAWLSQEQHLASWVLSFETARGHFHETVLVTDYSGARLLVDQLGLPFDRVYTDLNELDDCDMYWWVLGKLHAYKLMKGPFLHIDNDVFLWSPISIIAPVVAQNPEHFAFGAGQYRPDLLQNIVTAAGGSLPEEWTWYTSRRGNEAVCCGVLGGAFCDFLEYYATKAIEIVAQTKKAATRLAPAEILGSNILIEQYFLSACLAYHAAEGHARFRDVYIRYLFESEEQAFSGNAAQIGYTHLIAGAKRDTDIAQRILSRVRKCFPEYHNRIFQMVRLMT